MNSMSTPTLSAFLVEVQKISDNEYFRLDMVTLDNIPCVITMKKNVHYFPTKEFMKKGKEWVQRTVEGPRLGDAHLLKMVMR